MTGAFAIRTAAAAPERVAAVASFHGGGLATDQPDSPHLVIGNTQARYLIAIAASDDMNDPNAKNTLRTALEAAGRPHTVEVYEGVLHGRCVRDMPVQNGTPIYNEPQAERAWSELLALYSANLPA
jgi:carboxymethylenebutenolidase